MERPEPVRPRPPTAPLPATVLLGGYTAEAGGRAAGVASLVLGPDGYRVADVAAVASPSYLVAHPDQPWVFAVTEGAPSLLTALRRSADGRLDVASQVDIGGDGGCHLALADDARHLVVACYGSGTVVSVALATDGTLDGPVDTLALTGSGPDRERQQGPHAHQVVPVDDELLVCDLGTDQVHRLSLDDRGRLGRSAPAVALPPGTGPRHLAVVGEHLVVVGELDGRLHLLRRHAGGWNPVHALATSGRDAEPVQPSALRATGRRLLVANRGVGTVALFTLQPDRHRLVRTSEVASGGRGPRDLALAADRVWVADSQDDVISVFAWPAPADPDVLPSGPQRSVPAGSPSCVLPLPG